MCGSGTSELSTTSTQSRRGMKLPLALGEEPMKQSLKTCSDVFNFLAREFQSCRCSLLRCSLVLSIITPHPPCRRRTLPSNPCRAYRYRGRLSAKGPAYRLVAVASPQLAKSKKTRQFGCMELRAATGSSETATWSDPLSFPIPTLYSPLIPSWNQIQLDTATTCLNCSFLHHCKAPAIVVGANRSSVFPRFRTFPPAIASARFQSA